MAEREPDFFSDPAVIDHPIEYFNAMRARCPVAKEPYQGALMVTGYDEAIALLNVKDGTWSASVNVLGPLAVTFEPEGDDIAARFLDEELRQAGGRCRHQTAADERRDGQVRESDAR